MPIACVTFDLDDTLWPVGPVITRAEERFYAWLAQRCPRITEAHDAEALTGHRRAYMQRFPGERHDLTRLRKRWLGHVFESHGYHGQCVEEAFRVFWEHRNAVQLYDEVPQAMEALRERFALGVITNGNACVEFIGIDHWFDFVVSAEQAGAAKPAPLIFEAALERAGVCAEQVVHVGDDPENDVRGAAAVGMRTVWVNPALRPWPGGPEPDAVVHSLAELAGAVEVLAR
jgi:putative hydrolase of the HAD superfamily